MAADALHDRGRRQRPDHEADRERHDGDTRRERRPVQAGLQIDAADQEKRAVAIEQKREHEAERERAVEEQLQIDERMAVMTNRSTNQPGFS
jgi:hypothetical protein